MTISKCVIQPASLRPDLWVPALLPDHLVLGASKAGVIWFFSLKDGQHQRTVDLGGVDHNELERLDLLDHFLLGMEPNRDHQLIVLTRDPDVLVQAAALAPSAWASTEVRSESEKRFAENVTGKTSLKWLSIDPLSGKKTTMDRPGEFPEDTSYLQQSQMRFLIGPEGRVHANTLGPWSGTLEKMGLNKTPTHMPAQSTGAEGNPGGTNKDALDHGPTPPQTGHPRKPLDPSKAN